MDYDTLIYAAIAVALLLRLWFVFGRRNEEDPQRPNPFIMPAPGPKSDQPDASTSPPKPKALIGAAPESLAGGLEQIKALDPTFDERAFLQSVRATFTTIVEDFAKGDMSGIASLLGPNVLPHFQNAIDARQKAGQSMESHIWRINDAETTAAKTDGTRAIITVRFVSHQENILRDASGQIVSGAPGKIEEITDIWTFTRDTAAKDPNWILTETRS